MPKHRLVRVEIDAGRKRCKQCGYLADYGTKKMCLLFEKSLDDSPSPLRLKECVENELSPEPVTHPWHTRSDYERT